MAEYTISAADVPESSNFSLAPGEEDFKDDFSSTPRSLLGQSGERDRANISPIASGNTAQTYSIIVAVAEDVENGGRLAGVEGDIILVFNELNARTAGSVTVITDARKYFEAATVNGLPKALPPSLHSIVSRSHFPQDLGTDVYGLD
ncbi:hypothetical protein FRB90_009623 [Tulasnella sp. 427]|nr:hypothetical protein FRB90_009623 [Tulasnella sp. 427]